MVGNENEFLVRTESERGEDAERSLKHRAIRRAGLRTGRPDGEAVREIEVVVQLEVPDADALLEYRQVHVPSRLHHLQSAWFYFI